MFSHIGKKVSKLDTPALLVDLDRFERNLKKLPQSLLSLNSPVKVRPHTKAHKCPTIAHKQVRPNVLLQRFYDIYLLVIMFQVAHGAVGICCQKLSEAESMVTNTNRQ